MSEPKKDHSSSTREQDKSKLCQKDCNKCKNSTKGQKNKNNSKMEEEKTLNMKHSTNNDIHFDLLKYQDYLTYGTYDRIHFDMLFRRYR